MKTRIIVLFAVLLGMALGTQAAVPQVGDTIWLKSTYLDAPNYVVDGDNGLNVKSETDVNNALNFVVEDAGSGNVLLRVDGSTDYWHIPVGNNVSFVGATPTTNTLAHFTFQDVSVNKIGLISVGYTASPVIQVRGAKKTLNANTTSVGTDPGDTVFEFGVLGAVAELEPPTGLSANATASQVVLNWTDGSSAGVTTSFTVYRSTSSGVTNTDTVVGTITNVTETTITDTTVTNGTTYYYAVSATDGTATEWSAEVGPITPPLGTDQPENLSALTVPGAVLLDWDRDSTGHLDYYNVYRSTSSNVTIGVAYTNVTASDFIDVDVVAGTTYYYAVTAFGTNGVPQESALSAEISATPFAAVTNTVLFQHIDASVAASVQTNGAGEVTNVVDQSTFGNDATDVADDLGPVLWPSTDLFGSGLAGFDMGTDMQMLNLLTTNSPSGGTDAFLDFTGAASSSDGFAMLVAFKTRTVTTATGRDNVFLNCGSLELHYTSDGVMELDLGGTTITQSGQGVEAGDTIVYAVNYNALTGEMTFWDSKNYAETVDTTDVYGDFSGDPLLLGGSGRDSKVFDGLIGEVKIFSTKLPVDEFQAERFAMGEKWGAFAPTKLSTVSGDEIVLLNWANYNIGTVSNYTVYRSTSSPVTTNDVLTTVTDSDYNDTAVINGTTYYYAVSATDTDGTVSALSDEASATPIAPIAGELFQHIDADDATSVTVGASNAVISVADQTANTNDAVANVGTVLYPSVSVSASGLDGLDFSQNTNRNNLLLLDQTDTAGLLDFSGAAATHSGVAILVAFKVDAFQEEANPLVATDVKDGLSLDYNEAGSMRALLGDLAIEQPGALLAAGDTVVYSFNYTAKTGVMRFWDSKNDDVQLATNELYGSFNENANLLLGGNHNDSREMVGMIGEVKIYNKSLSDAELAIEQNALKAKWGTATATEYEVWANSWGEFLGSETDDFDNDGVGNLAEYAFAGNPTNGVDDTGIELLNVNGELVYVYPVHKYNLDLDYGLQTSTNLLDGWTTVADPLSWEIGYYEPAEGDFDYSTNSVPTEDTQMFIRSTVDWF